MSQLIDNTTNTIVKKVKNLGWLLRNWKSVKSLEISETTTENYKCKLIAHLYPYMNGGGCRYETDFASYEHCLEWLKRPVFIGVTLVDNISNTETQISK